jgi:hypothetical protein
LTTSCPHSVISSRRSSLLPKSEMNWCGRIKKNQRHAKSKDLLVIFKYTHKPN